MKKLWGEEEHGLGINRRVARSEVEALERAIFTAAGLADTLGVKVEVFLDLCDAALDVASVREMPWMDLAARQVWHEAGRGENRSRAIAKLRTARKRGRQ